MILASFQELFLKKAVSDINSHQDTAQFNWYRPDMKRYSMSAFNLVPTNIAYR